MTVNQIHENGQILISAMKINQDVENVPLYWNVDEGYENLSL